MSLNLVELPFDVLLQIAEYLDVQDVLRIRKASKRLFELSRERALWNSLYRACRYTRPLGPHPSQTRETLESILIRTLTVHHGMFHRTEPIRSRTVSVSEDSEALEFCGRWVFMRNEERVDCLDLSKHSSEHEEPRKYIVWEADKRGGFELLAMDCLDIVAHDGHKHTVVVLDHRARGPPAERAEVIILEIHFDEDSELGLRWESVYRKVFSDVSSEAIYSYISPTALLVMVGLQRGTALVWSIDHLDKEPVIIPRENDNIDDLPLFFVCSTHVVSVASVDGPPDVTHIRAWSLATLLTGAIQSNASAVIDDVYVQIVGILRDSVLDCNSGKTEVVFVGQLSRDDPDDSLLAVARLLIPPEGVAHGLTLSLQVIMQFPSDPIIILSPSCNGSMRLVYSLEESSDRRLGAVELTYDEETQTTTTARSPNLGVASNVQDHFQRCNAELQSFESEPHSGRILYTYYVQHPQGDPSIIPEEQRMLRIIDFA